MIKSRLIRNLTGVFLLAGSSAGCITLGGMPMNTPSDSVNDSGIRTTTAGPFARSKEDPASADVFTARALGKDNDPINCAVSRSLMAKWGKADPAKDRAAELSQDLEELQNKERTTEKDIEKCVAGTEYEAIWKAQQKAKADKAKAAEVKAANVKKAAKAKKDLAVQ